METDDAVATGILAARYDRPGVPEHGVVTDGIANLSLCCPELTQSHSTPTLFLSAMSHSIQQPCLELESVLLLTTNRSMFLHDILDGRETAMRLSALC